MAATCSGGDPQHAPMRSMPRPRRRWACSVVADELRESGVRLGNEEEVAGARGGQLRRDLLHLARTTSTVGADSVHAGLCQLGHGACGRDSHHRPEVGVEAERGDDGKVRSGGSRRAHRSLHLREVAHGLDQDEVDATLDEPAELVFEDRLSRAGIEVAER